MPALYSVGPIPHRLFKLIVDERFGLARSGRVALVDLLLGNISSKLDAGVNPISHVLPSGFHPIYDPDTGLPTNLPSRCDPSLFNPAVTNSAGNVVGAVCYEALGKNGQPAGSPGSDGVPDGFPVRCAPIERESELNKRFSAAVICLPIGARIA